MRIFGRKADICLALTMSGQHPPNSLTSRSASSTARNTSLDVDSAAERPGDGGIRRDRTSLSRDFFSASNELGARYLCPSSSDRPREWLLKETSPTSPRSSPLIHGFGEEIQRNVHRLRLRWSDALRAYDCEPVVFPACLCHD